ncbi:hypothetical protein SULI_12900 [Saccharolobus solfataricus]|uniref:Uncharacterized protein n=2 Tax=Saccharolobus solfataricus TaxID=2287 RepID=A0A0E3GX19_SACSO|nr:hypothetical protein [Saccharolobus solfataricus]AKA74666.1 hypothetical protein SULB_2545 [Saccharolobus solfataricus]AKA77360.1 hypothetical protein SULC_2540 [Saccharolobus solfataricus]AKA80051.1 hypothetical protein SULA_2542 [Saccharolobus solfataricus]AZF69130.1 hypothetical protein SULG_12900 [Saccharolobus solfataricus]AZF71750.1 hypothetical protein SULH_12900 [Saccharolobus solfataricus]
MNTKDNELDDLFVSKDPHSLKIFLNSFDSIEDIIKWSRNRPRAPINIHIIEGDPRIVVVVPTSDIFGNYARTIKKIFEGLSIIFIQSKGKYFNFAYSVNIGLREALKMDPEWIIVSNDDMIMIDKSDVLINELNRAREIGAEVVFTPQSDYHSIPVYVCKLRSFILIGLYSNIKYHKPKIDDILYMRHIRRKLKIKYDIVGDIGRKNIERKMKLICNRLYKIINGGSFMIFSKNFVKKFGPELLDETYINTYDDVDLYFRIFYEINPRITIINYRIGDIIRGSLDRNPIISLKRDIIALAYFNYKFQNYLK